MSSFSPLLAVHDMKESIKYYRDSLGFTAGMAFPDAENPEYIDLSKDGMVVMLVPAANLGIATGTKLGTGANFYLQIDGDIDEYYSELKRRGTAIIVDIKDEPFGIRAFTVEDQNGYQITFNQISQAQKSCLSCGMPLAKPEDFGGGNPANVYCVHCARLDGSLKSRNEVHEGMVSFMMMSQKMDRDAAEKAAREYMSRMPAWNGS